MRRQRKLGLVCWVSAASAMVLLARPGESLAQTPTASERSPDSKSSQAPSERSPDSKSSQAPSERSPDSKSSPAPSERSPDSKSSPAPSERKGDDPKPVPGSDQTADAVPPPEVAASTTERRPSESRAASRSRTTLVEASAERRFEWERFDPSRDDVPLLQLQLGIQSVYVSDLGFDPFSKNDSLTMPGASLSATLWQGGPFSFATGVFWEYGSTSATARGARTRLKAHRFGVGLEGRYHLARWLYAYARATPGLMAESASVDMMDRSSELEDSHLLLSMSGSGGLAVCLSARRPGSPRSGLAFWVLGEGGYLWSERATISLAPPSREDGAAEGNVTLGGLSLSGGFFRVSLAATY